MKAISLAQIVQAMDAQLLLGVPTSETLVQGVSLDSRTARAGDLFFALAGQKTDGHHYVAAAFEAGAVAAVVSRFPEGLENREFTAPKFLLKVADPLAALQKLAGWYRQQFDLPVVGVTGSTGKTTTKDLIAAVLSSQGPVLKTEENFNNEIGLPLTVLGLEDQHWAAVLEMGMRGRGEIAALCHIARPTIGVITNIGHTHQELLGSIENIARAKGELLENLPAEGVAILNGDDPWLRQLAATAKCRVVFFGLKTRVDYRGGHIKQHGKRGVSFTLHLPEGGSVTVDLPVPGEHNVINALAAFAVGCQLGLGAEDMARALQQAKLSSRRLDFRPGPQGAIIINDVYNANPDSMRAALQVLQAVALEEAEKNKNAASGTPRTVAVLGEMYELGDFCSEGHRLVGEEVARLNISLLITVGELAEDIALGAKKAGFPASRVVSVKTNAEAARIVLELLETRDVILVKGSRGMRMEQIVEAIEEARRMEER